MPSALETLVKILKLEQDTDYQDRAVIGGLKSFASHWVPDAHAQAKKPEHHLLIDELAVLLNEYGSLSVGEQRREAIKYMLGRITGRVPPKGGPVSAPPVQPPQRVDTEPAEQRGQSQQPQRDSRYDRPREPQPESRREPERQPDIVEQPVQSASEMLAGDNLVAEAVPAMSGDEPQFAQAPEPVMPRTQPTRPVRQQRRKRGQRDPQREIETMRALEGSVANISGIGPKMAEKLEQLGVRTIEDLLYLFPRRYDDYTRLVPLNRLEPDQVLTVIGTVRN